MHSPASRPFTSIAALVVSLALPAGLALIVAASGTGLVAAATQSIGATPPARIEFRAIAEGGRPVLDIEAREISLEIDGRTTAVRSMELIDALRTDLPPRGAIPEPFATNAPPMGGAREIWLVLDDESLAPGREQPFQAAVRRLLTGLSRGDRVGFGTVRNLHAGVGLTDQHENVLAAVNATHGRAPAAETPVDVACRTRVVLQALETVIQNVASASRGTIVFFSTSLMAPDETAVLIGSAAPDLCQVRLDDFQKLANAGRAASADFYVAHLVDGVAAGTSVAMQAGLHSLAGTTGGDVIRVSGNNENGLDRVLRETSAAYRITFDSPPVERNHPVRRIALRINRSGVTVRAPSEIAIPNARTSQGVKAPSTREMMRSQRVYRDLPLRATA